MLMEGVVLYVLLIVVFIQGKEKKYIIFFTALSYGNTIMLKVEATALSGDYCVCVCVV